MHHLRAEFRPHLFRYLHATHTSHTTPQIKLLTIEVSMFPYSTTKKS